MEDDHELMSLLDDVLDSFCPDTAREHKALGIARQLMQHGFSSLSKAQEWTFDQVFTPLLRAQQDVRDRARIRDLLERDSPP